MSTEIAFIDDAELAALAAEMGASASDLQGGGTTFLPQLKIWSKDDDEAEDAPRLKGKLYLTGTEEPLYAIAGTIVFRPLTQVFQWTQWDKTAKKTTNRTRLIYAFTEEARDEKGSVRCGKPTSKVIKENPELKDKYDDITTYRRLQGLVSYRGKTAQGVEGEVVDQLISINLKGDNFTPFDAEFIKLMPAKSNLWDWNCNITTTRHVNGSVTYWVLHFTPDFANKQKFTMEIYETLKGLKSQIDDLNKQVDTKYYDALNGVKQDEEDAKLVNSLKGSRALNADMDEDIPF